MHSSFLVFLEIREQPIQKEANGIEAPQFQSMQSNLLQPDELKILVKCQQDLGHLHNLGPSLSLSLRIIYTPTYVYTFNLTNTP